MEVELLKSPSAPEDTVVRAARNDYMSGWVAEKSIEDVLSVVDVTDVDRMRGMEVVDEFYDAEEGVEYYADLVGIEARKHHLIKDLLKKGHFGPFEHPQFTFAVKGVSRSLMAQLTRHRHASFDVQSMRYVSFDDAEPGELFVEPHTVEDVNFGGRNPHGTDLETVKEETGMTEEEIQAAREEIYHRSVGEALENYKDLVDLGMPPEDARFVLPIGTKVNLVFSVNARMLMHVADMRAAADAQWEIREMTEDVLDIAKEEMPHTFGIYEDELKNRKNRLAP